MAYKEVKISCILINKNHGNLLEQSINSILKQDYKNKEIIIVDGGSTDNSLNIINKYQNHLDVIISENDKGPADAMNKGYELSKGQIITFMNSDDQKALNAFNEVNMHYQKNKQLVDIYFSPFCVSNQQGKVLYKVSHNRLIKFNLHNVLNEQFGFNSFFIKRESFSKLGGLVVEPKKNGNIYYSTDRLFAAKAIINNYKFLKMRTTFHQYTAHEYSATFSKQNWILMKLEAKKVAKYLLKDPLISKKDQFLIELYELKNILVLGIIYFSKGQFNKFCECIYIFLKSKSLYVKILALICVFREIIYRLKLRMGLT